jgi:hypothetical protein
MRSLTSQAIDWRAKLLQVRVVGLLPEDVSLRMTASAVGLPKDVSLRTTAFAVARDVSLRTTALAAG